MYIGQFSNYTMKLKKKYLTENSNNFLGVGPFFPGRSGKGKQNFFLFRPRTFKLGKLIEDAD